MALRGTGPKSRLSSEEEGSGWDVVGLSSIDEDAFVATDDRVARYADDTFGEVEIACVRVGRDRAADVASRVDDHELSAVRVAEVVGEPFGEGAWVAWRDRRGIAYPAGAYQHEQVRQPENHGDDNKRENRPDRYQDALAAEARPQSCLRNDVHGGRA